MFNVSFNNKTNEDMNFSIVKRYNPPVHKRRYKEFEVSGRDGKLYQDLGTYEDIEISLDCNFIAKRSNWDWESNFNRQLHHIKKWLNNIIDNKLQFSDMDDNFYQVNKVEITSIERVMKNLCRFTINFTCKPHQYLIKGQKEIKVNGVLFNHWDICKPTYQIVGNGNCLLDVNGTTVNCNVNNNIIIDTEYDKILNSDKTLAVGKTDIKAMQDLYLKEGKNNITITNGFELYIKPNYRTI